MTTWMTDLGVFEFRFRARPFRKQLPLGSLLALFRHPQVFLLEERVVRELDPVPPHLLHLFLGCVSKPERTDGASNGPLASCSSRSCSGSGDCGSASP